MGYYLITTGTPPGIGLRSLIVQANDKADIINHLTDPIIAVFAIIEFTEDEVKQFRPSINILDWRSKKLEKMSKPWKRYRFKTKSINDYRPLVFNPRYPWWCTGEGDDYVTIVAYLPENEELSKYWDDAYDITYEEEDEIKFSGRFPKPGYFEEDEN